MSTKPSGAAVPAVATDPCVHCGFCLPTCASYRVLGTEMDSPRGRIHALKAIAAGELSLDPTVASHFDSCLGCFACVTACPSGVRYDQLIDATRPQLNAPELRSPAERVFRKLLFSLLPYPKRLRAVLTPLRAYVGTPLQGLTRKLGLARALGPQLEAMERLLPPLAPEGFADRFPVVVPAQGERRARVGLLLGCVQRVFDPEVNAAAVRVLAANGIDPRPQGGDVEWQAFPPDTLSQVVADGRVDIAAGDPAKISTPVGWGNHRLEIKSDNASDLPTSINFEVGWSGDASAETPDLLQVTLDKQSYRAGEQMRLQVASRFDGKASIANLPPAGAWALQYGVVLTFNGTTTHIDPNDKVRDALARWEEARGAGASRRNAHARVHASARWRGACCSTPTARLTGLSGSVRM